MSTFSPREHAVMAAMQEAFVPDAAPTLSGGRDHLARRLDAFFAGTKPTLRLGVRILLLLLELSPLLHRRARLSRLDVAERTRWLARLIASDLPGVRALGQIPKLLVQSVVYDDPDFLRAEGLPDPRGPVGAG